MPVIICLLQLVNVLVKKCTWNFYYDARVIFDNNTSISVLPLSFHIRSMYM